ncbi:epoxide hydrolase, soluble (sEH) [Phlyctochytrium bullatum]|nr:epoxide hydrolase, soluble (sEH) [Phlyctochytrium bullatum]
MDHKGSVQDIEFAPNHLGLKIATTSADGYVRIYEAMDVVNLTAWDLVAQIEVYPGAKESDHLCLSWCPSRFQPEMLVVGCGRDNVAKVRASIYRQEDDKQWKVIETLGPHGDIVTDISWAPNMGRSYQLIATSSKDKIVRIFRLSEDEPQSSSPAAQGTAGSFGLDPARAGMVGVPGALQKRTGRLKVQSVTPLEGHMDEVWRVEWNITATVLCSSGDDGNLRLWTRNFTPFGGSMAGKIDEWRCKSVVRAEAPPDGLS